MECNKWKVKTSGRGANEFQALQGAEMACLMRSERGKLLTLGAFGEGVAWVTFGLAMDAGTVKSFCSHGFIG